MVMEKTGGIVATDVSKDAQAGAMKAGPAQDKDAQELVFDVGDLDCADCAAHFEEAVRKLKGVSGATLNFATAALAVAPATPDPAKRQALRRAIEKLGQQMGHPATLRGEPAQATAQAAGWITRLREHRRDLLTGLSGLLVSIAFVSHLLQTPEWASNALYALGILVGGYNVARAGWYGFLATRSLDMNALMTLAAVGAMAIGEWAEGAMVIFLFSLGNTLESYTISRARTAIRSLMTLAPKAALRLAGERQEQVAVETLAVGDRILVRPDERIPMDGIVESGHSAVNQAPVTGESIPVEKEVGNEVYAGTVNGEGSLMVRVTRLAKDNTIVRIIRMVEEAQASKAPSQRFVDRFSRVYTPLVIAGAVGVAIIPPLLGAGAFGQWFYRALVLLVISCPCALVISTPVSIVSAIASAARMGVLVKGGAYLEVLGAIKVVAFDKTGTLTQGQPVVVGAQCELHDSDIASEKCTECRELFAQAVAVEQYSQHPIARAVVAQAGNYGVDLARTSAEDVRSQPGRGISGVVKGHKVAVGSHSYTHENHKDVAKPEFCQLVDASAAEGKTTVVVEDECCGRRAFIAVADTLRPSAPQVIADLKRSGVVQTVMLTGDNQATAEAIARQAGVDQVRAGLSPEGKVEAIKDLLAAHGQVAMIGDGVNDAPALAQATVGVAMGAIGTDAALETADVALMADDLTKLVPTMRLSHQTLSTIKQNIAISLFIKALFLGLAVAGVATLWMAVFADVGTSMVVIANGMRLLRVRGS